MSVSNSKSGPVSPAASDPANSSPTHSSTSARRIFTRLPVFGQAVEQAAVFIKSIVSPNRAVRKILTGTS